MRAITDKRLLPPGFAWGMALVAAYAAARALAFGLDFHLVVMCGVILSALLAAVYTHAKESPPPAAGKRAWAMGFWGLVFMMFLSILGDIEIFLFPAVESARFHRDDWRTSWKAFIGFCLLGWVSVRWIYFARLRGNTPEGWAGAILVLLGVSYILYYADEHEHSLNWHTAAAFALFVIVCIRILIRRRKERQTKKANRHE